LTHRWIIKGMIPLSCIFLVLSAFDFFLPNLNILRGVEVPLPDPETEVMK